MNLQTSIQYLKGVGEKRAALLRRLGIHSVGDLLAYVPRAYEDWQTVYPIAQAPIGVPCCVRAVIDHAPTEHMLRGGLTLYKTHAADESGVLSLTIFNSGYQAEKLREGTEHLFYGKLTETFFAREMSAPQIAPVGEARLRPVYPLTEGLSSRGIERLMERAMELTLAQVKEFLPESMLEEYGLISRQEALRTIHRPGSWEEIERARRRLAFNELFLLQMGLALLRHSRQKECAKALPPEAADEFLARLPFVPTKAQTRAVGEAAADMAKAAPMRRLLQGDVGSGKTAVAAALLHMAAAGGAQAALMAPTELLARQHYETLTGLGLAPALLIGATPAGEKKRLKAALAAGELPLAVGTQALLQKDVAFANLALVIVDEQHRFGVEQRGQLAARGEASQEPTQAAGNACGPHLLVMSATPIPRSLAMVIYGELDISVLDELPPGRTPVETYCVGSALRDRAYQYVKKHLDQGRQGYLICPRVSESEKSETAAAQTLYEQLRNGAFEGYRVGLVHGKLAPKQKEEAMAAFAAGQTQLLVSTTVVEVGVDVPNAAIMVIENAEHFGLPQLHQLRGRIGRGTARSTCILISDAQGEEAQARFAAMKETNDGFEIARRDLELRGPGDFLGARQHGLPEFKLADIATDAALLQETREAAQRLCAEDPGLAQHSALRRACAKLLEASD
ncbi:MAG: ATP-dependent DNA helicase RecG [Oscillospiraceae bacterium]|jgi:ATP-dependent DNA helicase RecG|nr:ATP-dependent DNA helicase RecG [Oscillospiraceae bacterium]